MAESLLEFPARVTVKAMGLSSESFVATVESLARTCINPWENVDVRSTRSSKGKYTSVSITFEARDQAQLEAVYATLNTCPEILFKL